MNWNWTTALGIAVAVVVAISFWPQVAAFAQRMRAVSKTAPATIPQPKPQPQTDKVVENPYVAWFEQIVDAAGPEAEPEFIIEHAKLGSNREQVMSARIKKLVKERADPETDVTDTAIPAPAEPAKS